MGRNALRAAAVVTLAALFTGTATASFGASVEEVTPPQPIDSPTGNYIVLLDEEPVAGYEGGEPGLAPTKPEEGDKLDTKSNKAKRYAAFLEKRQEQVADEAGVETSATYQVTLNGFSAQMSPEQAAKLASTKGVLGVYPDEIRHPDAVPSTEFLGLEGDGGVWDAVGGVDAAGEGVVVGVVDTGIAPESPSFAGEPLGTIAGDEPYLDGNEVVFTKADGNEFRSERVTGEEWDASFYSTKLVGAQYFSTGAAAAGFDFGPDYLSPRDGDGHGSHTASTAAGNHDVAASVSGTDFGAISGVAPAAKVASYKACYVGPDPLSTSDDICALSDLLDAIDAAVEDGVDVINYSIGGGSATSTLAADDVSFFYAAVAGVFVSVSAGNSGPGASTADHASPWYTTVAASTIPTYEGTVQLPNGFEAAGASVTVPFGESVTDDVIYAGDAVAPDADPAEAAMCFLDTLDPALIEGKIVVCDRGVIARVEKSQAVDEAGGIGMILVNVTPGSLDNDFHSVPTVHINAQYRDDLLDYVRNTEGATATLVGDNVTGVETPTPQVAGFSSRGPMLADGSDVIKPDISAPGVAILAAAANQPGEQGVFEFLSGTSMSSPHIAGLAALYLGERPLATPDEIKSAMMTTAYDTVDAAGDPISDPFTQGAGHVDPTKFFEPGLLYLNGPNDWAAFIEGTGNADFGDAIDPIDPSELNLASVGIGSLSSTEDVTRTVTATTAGTYTASVSVPGVDVSVSPASVTLAEGESADFTLTFTNASAPVEQWATGSLTWTSDSVAVRSPIAVRPVTAEAPATVAGEGVSSSVDVTFLSGITGDLELQLSGLAELELLEGPGAPEGHSGDETSGDANGDIGWIVSVEEGTRLAQWTLDSSDDEGSDLDLFVYHVVAPDDLRYYEMWQSASGSADEQVTIDNPEAGTYMVIANMYSVSGPMTWNLTEALVTEDGVGSLTAIPNPVSVTQGEEATYTVAWSGLDYNTSYLGVVQYGDSEVRTLVSVDSGAEGPVATKDPKITGSAKVGKTLKVNGGRWDPKKVTLSYQWLRDGEPIEGATSASYKVATTDVGTALSVRVSAVAAGNVNPGTAVTDEVFVKSTSKTKVTMNRYSGSSSQTFEVTVAVTPTGGGTATGDVTVWVDTKKYTATLKDGKAKVSLPKQKKGVHVVTAYYAGSDAVDRSAGLSGFFVTR
ncbi:S8 family serine peptidase [Microbacterium sp. C7(2022)]|uniref:S8 family serine peptidase n=1 Tax=Microbacterium sp. C7(2022) TaxID=2992759 RepID=UPI00237B5168|nr:S8 family serine peptidase [Microbacterium sp. C7(2022)]MDE0545125.1 S8 family serine peptidase [Microbacterium sp. C7(2022)]